MEMTRKRQRLLQLTRPARAERFQVLRFLRELVQFFPQFGVFAERGRPGESMDGCSEVFEAALLGIDLSGYYFVLVELLLQSIRIGTDWIDVHQVLFKILTLTEQYVDLHKYLENSNKNKALINVTICPTSIEYTFSQYS